MERPLSMIYRLKLTEGKPVKEVRLAYPKETLKEHVSYEVSEDQQLHVSFKEPVMARIFEISDKGEKGKGR